MILQHKPRVKFDPSKKQHRHAIKQVLTRNAWSDSPFNFDHDPSYGNLLDQVKDQLLKWYLNKELNNKVKDNNS